MSHPLSLEPPIPKTVQADEVAAFSSVVVRPGDSLATLFQKQGLSYLELHKILELGEQVAPIKTIHPGDKLHFVKGSTGQLRRLSYTIDPTKRLVITATGEGFTAETKVRPLETRIHYAQGSIRHSLFLAAQESDISEIIIMEMANLFGWDIDFALEVRPGDRFSVIYEASYRDGDKVVEGPILAAEFINQGRKHRAVRYTRPDGRTDYFSPDGRTLRKAFLRTPVKLARISSYFSSGRYHPILHKARAHKGVDYAAPSGTPVRATGDGKITFRGTKGGYGKTVIIQHGNRYSTLYAHLSRFAKSKRKGKRVKQGQVIGYVGQTGLATGPHLHYEFRINGVHRDPLRVKFPGVAPLEEKHRRQFEQHAASSWAQLDTLNRTWVALKDW